MRLNKIKLAGFKSFVDPTTIQLVSNLTAVAGPNGCGKSNVIDAVRWVMGESSAKNLRGGAIADVIFNGSSARKPVGQATVELLFENTEGKLGGEYASYSEIAIKRQVTRDGISTYFLNGQRCRRRDITDIFLGTGLGPRSYAIIEQGMITRVIEAKPEDLRNFLEEAAGISKYKERRKETENRIQHTHDNIARVNDIRGELEKQLNRLQRQSQAAEQYKILNNLEKETSAQLAALIWQRLDVSLKETETKVRELTVKLEEEQTHAQHLKTEQEKQRLAQVDTNEALNEVQKHYYSIGSEIAKIEQTIQHHLERKQQLLQDKQEAEHSLLFSQSQLEQDQSEILKFQQQIDLLEPQYERAQIEADSALASLQHAEKAQEAWQEQTNQLLQEIIQPREQAESEKTKIAQLERQMHQTQERLHRLQKELDEQPKLEISEMDILEEKIFLCQASLEKIIEEISTFSKEKEKLTSQATRLRQEINKHLERLNETKGQLCALNELQVYALGKDKARKKDWLQASGVNHYQYLAEKMTISPGWEIAIETVLAGFLDAIAVEQGKLPLLTKNLDSLQEQGINIIAWDRTQNPSSAPDSLLGCVKASELLPQVIYQSLSKVRCAATLFEATQMLSLLSSCESVITPQGYWLGQGWLRVTRENESGILFREEKIKTLKQEIEKIQEELENAQSSLDTVEEKIKISDLEKEAKQQEKNRVHQEITVLQSEQQIKQNKIEQIQKRKIQIQQDEVECKEIIQSAQSDVQVARLSLQRAIDKMEKLNFEQEILLQKKTQVQEALSSERIKVKETARQFQQLHIDLQSYSSQSNALNNNIERLTQQFHQGQTRVNNLIFAISKTEEPINTLKEALKLSVEKRIIVENQLNQARDNVAACDNVLRELEIQLNLVEEKIIKIREQLESLKMHWQAIQVRSESALEKLKNTTFSLKMLLENMPADANESRWQTQVEELEQKILKLGPIHLGAIEEYEAASSRKEYLDEQCNDLLEALNTLENAIKKIDRETRAKFQETFDHVNENFMKLFPQVFGGGQGQLSMTGEDLLDTGITLMARPPGKKNSTISQLSGGEKALTAVALVFSLFQLNPAPFCMLDEVDSPLDDNNVGRFCHLVKEMSKTIQFIYVSHNKLAIEMAEQLQGVTMREPGVSRLVTVDIEQVTMSQ